MPGCCHDDTCSATTRPALDSPAWRRVLWVALIANAAMFGIETFAGVTAGSASLLADALDFLSDSANYAISLAVAGMALAVRSRAAMVKGGCLLVFGFYVAASTVWHAVAGTLPRAEVMGVVGALALLTNGVVALLLFRFRQGDANMRSVWICSRNDAIGNVAVLAAAAGVFGTGTQWPDIIVAAIMAALGLVGGMQIILHARRELAGAAPSAARPTLDAARPAGHR